MHIKQTHISAALPNLLKEHVSPTHGLTDKIKHENTTRGHKTLGTKRLFEPRFSHQSSLYLDGEVAPNLPTFHTANRCTQPHNKTKCE